MRVHGFTARMAACLNESFISSDGATAAACGDDDAQSSNAGVSGSQNGIIIGNGDNETRDEDYKEFCDQFEFVVS